MPPRSRKIEARPYKDRHGKTRWRVRIGKQQRNVPSPSDPEHRLKVALAVASMESKKSPHKPYSLSWVVADYKQSNPNWKKLGKKTKADKNALFKRMQKPWGGYDMRTLTEVELVRLMDAVPANATHNRMKTLWNQLFGHMKRRGWRKDNPSDAIQRRKWKAVHTHIWTDAERALYRSHWPIGTKQRAAYHLMFDTRQASADMAHMGSKMEDGDYLSGDRVKTGGTFTVFMTDELRCAISPFRSLTSYVLTHSGLPYSERGIHNAMSDWISEAGLPDRCTPHGLRGAGLTKDAENGATEKELMNTGGFERGDEVRIYIREANRRKLAKRTHERHLAANRRDTDDVT